MQINNILREQINRYIENTSLEYSYIYNIDLIHRNIQDVKNVIGSSRLFLDFDVFPDRFTSKILGMDEQVHFICSNSFQSTGLRSLQIPAQRVFEIFQPSEQKKIESSSESLISHGRILDATFAVVSIDMKKIIAMSQMDILHLLTIAEAKEIILKIRTSSGSLSLEEIESLADHIQKCSIDKNVKIGIDATSYVFQSSATLMFRVLYTKTNHGHNYAICSAGTNVLHAAGHGLNPRKHKFKIFPLSEKESSPQEQWTFTGPLCTPSDVIAIKYPIARPHEGDYYYVSCDRFELYYSPYSFISHSKPKELYYYNEELRSER